MTLPISIGPADVLIVVDPQVDFCPGGGLPVGDGSAVMPVINHLASKFANVVLTQDWHPADHLSFASSHPGASVFGTTMMPYGVQVLWPDHCIQGTPGAAFHEGLEIPHAGLVLRKGFRRNIDSYSAFYENDRHTPTGLAGYLRERSLTRLFFVGLALDFCVRYSAEDAASEGLEATVILDACRAIDLDGSMEATRRSFAERGIALVTANGTVIA